MDPPAIWHIRHWSPSSSESSARRLQRTQSSTLQYTAGIWRDTIQRRRDYDRGLPPPHPQDLILSQMPFTLLKGLPRMAGEAVAPVPSYLLLPCLVALLTCSPPQSPVLPASKKSHLISHVSECQQRVKAPTPLSLCLPAYLSCFREETSHRSEGSLRREESLILTPD